jgi:hypothetical protein
MERLRFTLSFLALALAASLASSCGASSSNLSRGTTPPSQGQGQLQSIALSPATADAQAYPNGQVQFVATGYYTDPTQTITPLSAMWGTCYQDAPTSEISVTALGVAQCAPGAVGTYTVWADDSPSPNIECLAMTACGGGCFIAGTAQLTCP